MDEDLRTIIQVIVSLILASHFTWSLNKMARYATFNRWWGVSCVLMGAGCFYLSMSPFLVGAESWGVLSVLSGLAVISWRIPEALEPLHGTQRLVWTRRKQVGWRCSAICFLTFFVLVYELVLRNKLEPYAHYMIP